MDEYIKRDGLLSKFNIDDMMNVNGTLISLHEARETISNFPAADVAPVRHGRWEETDLVELEDGGNGLVRTPNAALRCSNCRNCFNTKLLWKDAYCPNCGARMDGAE